MLSIITYFAICIYKADKEIYDIKLKYFTTLNEKDAALEQAVALSGKQDKMLELQRETIKAYKVMIEQHEELIKRLKDRAA